jgi:hypothetical protein
MSVNQLPGPGSKGFHPGETMLFLPPVATSQYQHVSIDHRRPGRTDRFSWLGVTESVGANQIGLMLR